MMDSIFLREKECDVSAAVKLVYVVIDLHSRGEWWACSLTDLSKLTGISNQTIVPAITKLQDRGMIKIDRSGRGRGKLNKYRSV